jgi:hypothetical protein
LKSISWAHAPVAKAAEVSPTNSHADFIGLSPLIVRLRSRPCLIAGS